MTGAELRMLTFPDEGDGDGDGPLRTISVDTLVLSAATLAAGSMQDEEIDMKIAFTYALTAIKGVLNDLEVYLDDDV
jgi:hypothetical protein